MPASPDPVAVSLLSKARASRDDLDARLLLAAAVTRVADSVGVRVVVTGGTAVDFYAAGAAGTSAAYPEGWRGSGDVDVVVVAVKSPPEAERRLKLELQSQLQLELQLLGEDSEGAPSFGRTIDVPDFGFGLEIVGDELRGDPLAERVVTVDVEGQLVALRSPEDTIVSYGEAGWETFHGRDWERALAVCRAMKDAIDMEYLRQRAAERRMLGVLDEIVAQRPLPAERRALF